MTRLISIVLLLVSTYSLATPRECGLALQRAVGARPDPALVDIIVAESVNKSEEFLTVLLALVAVESAFNPEARSPAGAYGLTQTTPIARQEVDNRWTGWQQPILLIGQDVYYGSAYLVLCYQDWGTVPLALACYNGGGRQARLLQQGRRMCTETANYVARVLNLIEQECGLWTLQR